MRKNRVPLGLRKLKLFFACLLMAVLSIGQVWATDDVINNAATSSALGSTGTTSWKSPDPTIVGASGAEYTIHSMGTSGTTNAIQWNKNGFLYQTKSGGTLKSVTIKGAAKKINIFASNTAYSAKATGTQLAQVTASTSGVTYTFESDYTYLAINGTESSTSITEITVAYQSGGGSDPTLSLAPSSLNLEAEGNSTQEITLSTNNFAGAVNDVTCAFFSTATCDPGDAISQPAWITNLTNNNTNLNLVSFDVEDNDGAARSVWMKVTASDGTGSASAILTISQKALVVDYATLPFSFTGGRADIENTSGMTQSGLGSDYTGSGVTTKLKFDGDNDNVIIHFNAAPGTLSFDIKGNSFSGGTFKVQESADGDTYTDIYTYSADGTGVEVALSATARYVKFIYVTKSSGNIGLGNIAISEYVAPAAVATPTFSGNEYFVTSTSVSLACTTTGAEIYYTLDGSDPQISDSKQLYSDPFSLTVSGPVNARAKLDDDWSGMVSKTFIKVDPIDVPAAIAAIPNKDDVVNDQFVRGIVCTAAPSLLSGGKLTYYISADGSETNRLQIYKGKNLNNTEFTAVSDLAIGDRVTVFGQLKNFNNTPEMNDGNYLVEREAALVAAPVFTPDGGGFMGETDVTITCATAGSAIYYTTDGETPSKLSTLYTAAIHLDATTTIKAIAYVNDDPSIVITKTFTLSAPMTVAAALTALDSEDPINNVAVAGIISTAPTNNPSSGRLTYYISDDGSASNELEVFNGFGLGGASFTDKTDLQVGDEVTVFGNLTIFNSTTKEFSAGSRLLAFNRPVVAVTGVTVESTASVAVGGHVTLHASVVPANAFNKTINWSIESGNDYVTLADGVVTGVAEGTAVIRATSDEDASIYAECTVTVAPLSPWATIYTSNVELSIEGGTSASVAKVKFYGEDTEYAALKAGTSNTAGAVVVNVPAGATALHFHAYSWYNETAAITVTAPTGVTVSPATAIAINKNDGIKENSPFTLAEGSTPQLDAYYAVSLSGNTEPIALTITATTGKRFVLFGVNQEGGIVLESIAVTGTATALEYTDGQHFDPAGLSVTGTYTDASTAPITEGIVWAFDPDPLTEGTTSVSVTATAGGFTSAPVVVDGLTVGGAAPLSPWATVYTSNVELSGATASTVIINETEYDAMKAGTGSASGSVDVAVPAQTTTLHFHASGWEGKEVTLNITAPDGITVTPASVNLIADAGVSGNTSTYTLQNDPSTTAYFAVTLSGNTDAFTLTFSNTGSKKQFVLYGVNQVGGVLPELQSIAISGDLDNKSYEAGQSIDMTGLTVVANYTLAGEPQAPVNITDDPNLEWSYAPLVKDQTSVTLTASFEGKNAQKTIDGLTVTEATPAITASPAFANFNNVSKDAVVAAKVINITLTNVAAATVALSGTGAAGFTVDKSALTESGTISITPVTTTVGSYSAKVTISDDAGVATAATVTLMMNVLPVDDGDALLSGVWTLVTDASQLVDGSKVIIAQYVNADGAIRTMSTANNNNRASVESTVTGTALTPAEGTRVMTLEALAGGKYAFRTNINTYLYAASSSSNYLKEQLELNDNGRWTISIEDGNKAVITATGTNSHRIMRYNEGSELFSCYESGQKDVQLFIRTADYSRTDMFSPGVIGTVCVDHNVPFAGIEGATFYELAGLVSTGFIAFDEIVSGQLNAGVPYLFQANSNELKLYFGTTVAPSPVVRNGMYGTFDPIDVTENLDDVYYFAQHNFWSCSGMSSLHMPANRAYVRMSEVPSAAPNPNPGRRRVVMGVNGTNTTTGCENIESGNAPRKQFIDGAIYIIRGEKVYDTTGRLVK